MRKIKSFIRCILLVITLTSCYTNIIDLNEIENGEDDKKHGLTVTDRSQLEQRITAESKICEVEFTTDSEWQVHIKTEEMQQWASVSPEYSENQGLQTLNIHVDENDTRQYRTAELTLSSGGKEETITISQSPQYADGTTPKPYNPDPYTDILSKISVQRFYNDVPDESWYEWRFVYDRSQQKISNMGYYLLSERCYENYYITDNLIEHNLYGLKLPEESFELLKKETLNLKVNKYNFIISNKLFIFDYEHETPDPIESQTQFTYSAYRRIAAKTNNISTIYSWQNENLTQQSEQIANEKTKTLFTYTYSEALNNKTNVDLNAFLMSDMYAAAGLMGKRSKNLLLSSTYFKGDTQHFEYTFDEQERVKTIIKKTLYNGNIESESIVYTMYYETNNNTLK